jgi:hypothetical protein
MAALALEPSLKHMHGDAVVVNDEPGADVGRQRGLAVSNVGVSPVCSFSRRRRAL